MPRIKNIKQSLTAKSLRTRTARHGRNLADVYTISVPEVSRVVTKQDPKTGEFHTERKIVQHAVTRPMTPAEIQGERDKVLRANGSTRSYGKKNEQKSGPKKAKVA